MKLKNNYFFTLRNDVKDEESISGNLLVKSGMIKRTSAGIYMYLPLGLKVINNIRNIINEEMMKAGSTELLMPSLISEDIYIQSGRKKAFGSDMFSLEDRYGKKYVLGPTHEELFTIAASYKVKSYKDLHFSIHQFQNKFRDEARPRFGLIRIREFMMKDAYSFDTDESMLDISYQNMKQAYKNIFDRLNVNYSIVTSDTGTMGGLLSEEFQALCEIGEDKIVTCPKCSYASNTDIAVKSNNYKICDEEMLDIKEVHTPNAKTIKEISDFLNQSEDKFIKTLIYRADNDFVAVLIPGNEEVNETKLTKLLKATTIELASEEEVEKITHSQVGFAGPCKINIKIVADEAIKYSKNMICGANKTDYHLINVNLERDFEVEIYGDISFVHEGDLCPRCKEKLIFTSSIEVGNIFKLGTKYSEAFNLKYTDEKNELQLVTMGCYGIGLGRSLASIVEQHYDDKGIIWPYEVAPYKVAIVIIDTKDEIQTRVANNLYDKLESVGIEVLFDDRNERPGVKFNDMDLIGIPYRIVVGKRASEDIVEFKSRRNSEILELEINEVIQKLEYQNSVKK